MEQNMRELKTVQRMTRLTPTLDKKLMKLADKINLTPSAYLCWLVEKAQSVPNNGYKK